MRIGKIEVKRRVWVSLACGIAVTGMWWMGMRTKPPAMAVTPAITVPFVRLTGASTNPDDVILRERAQLYDPKPLFFPTEWNYGQRPLPARLRRQPGQVFGSFDPVMTFADQKLKLYGAETTPAPEKLSDVLAQGNEAPFAGFGQIDVARPSLPVRVGFLEVRGFNDSKPIIDQSLSGFSPPRLDYAPLEFLVLISNAGVVGEPVVTSGSGWEEVDAFFRSYLVKTLRLGERLNPGRYRVLVGP
ncbi:hypothetical protein [Opitutus sp. GAS368]|jgi:hypothetical protein|uniref:hypothetical protein n=1 Tax=Opitutus sp. GAS368 TaxID=1882749 RepID=UPI00087D6D6A|nr:hypothetical protein [Opitutus sp. GAS368]SDR78432.1 hypothetical protein SAMN05444173_0865 [Opitutus sp. GAS368]